MNRHACVPIQNPHNQIDDIHDLKGQHVRIVERGNRSEQRVAMMKCDTKLRRTVWDLLEVEQGAGDIE